jgi:hypothetical protein
VTPVKYIYRVITRYPSSRDIFQPIRNELKICCWSNKTKTLTKLETFNSTKKYNPQLKMALLYRQRRDERLSWLEQMKVWNFPKVVSLAENWTRDLWIHTLSRYRLNHLVNSNFELMWYYRCWYYSTVNKKYHWISVAHRKSMSFRLISSFILIFQ